MVSLLALVLLALEFSGVAALRLPDLVNSTHTASIRAPFKKVVKHAQLKAVATRDRARAKALVARATGGGSKFREDAQAVGVLIANQVVNYIAAVNVGSPPTTFFLDVDTGSSNIWVGAATPFTSTSTTQPLNAAVEVSYGSGFFEGEEVLDLVDFGSPLTIPNQSIGVADFSEGFNGIDGIVGIGPTGLTAGTVQGQETVPTVTDNLAALGIIPARVVSVSFAPTNNTFDVNGELVFGGIDPGRFTGSLSVFPITATFPSSQFFGIDATFVQGGTAILGSAGIVDTGTTLVLLASQAFGAYATAAGAVLDSATGLLRVTPAQFAVLPTLDVVVGGVAFPLTPDGQRWPQQLNAAIGGSPDFVYLIVNNLGRDVGSGLDFILGQFFLERFYSVFDSSGFVGLAPTAFTNAVVNN